MDVMILIINYCSINFNGLSTAIPKGTVNRLKVEFSSGCKNSFSFFDSIFRWFPQCVKKV